jgi:hypothetical protein
MRTITLAVLGMALSGAAFAQSTGTPNTVTTAQDPTAGTGCLTVTVYDFQGAPHVSTWCPPAGG